ncbi:MAG: M20/M25/M40 family metallo-hydrolase, partial [Megasphaera elsdenii]|nr:M20/M25/M40 family metallo-hydrolase [Megasphaera elsdenii]
EVQWIPGPPALINDAHWGILARKVAEKQGFDKQPMAPSLGGEDFAFYYDKVPGYFVFVGTGHSYPNHNAKFKVNPAALYPASQYMAELACQAVVQIRQEGSSKK